ncbi:MAG TPA: hypothetical protein VF902_02815, partial [Coriobacteriia bacterium]
MRRPLVSVLAIIALGPALLFALPGLACATPSLSTPTNGGALTQGSEVFTWSDNYAQGSVDHWYLEISTSPDVDYYYFGYFWNPPVYASTGLHTASLNIGSALAPGTYYWHVVGYYGQYGINGVYWSPVQSFVVKTAGATAPAVSVTPLSLSFDIPYGDTASHDKTVYVSNSGGGTLVWSAAANLTSPQWLTAAPGPHTDYVYSLTIRANATGLPVGSRSSYVRVWDSGSTPPASPSYRDVAVTLRVYGTDAVGPTGASISINGGAATTSSRDVVLTLSATDSGSGMGEMRLHDGLSWGQWMPYDTSMNWRLSAGDGVKTLQAQFRDRAGNTSAIVSDSITLATVAPVHSVTAEIDNVAPNPATSAQTVTFSGHGSDTLGHGTSVYEWTSSLDGAIGTSSSFTKTGLSVGTHTISFRVRCTSGMWSSPVTVSLVVNAPPAVDTVNAAIDSVAPNPGTSAQTVTFAGH